MTVPRWFALGDLHLSEAGHKPMDRFGEAWVAHAPRMAAAWDALVAADDWVFLAGDLSWARDLEEARPDLAWIGRRPGRKLLLRGNHDSWWSSLTRVRQVLPPSCEPLQNNSLRAGEWVVVGARGWTDPRDPLSTEADEVVYRRELERLSLSVAHADAEFGRAAPRIAMVHFPPCVVGRERGPVVELLQQAGVRACVYGHLHGEDHRLAVTGELDGIVYHFVAADAVGFAPVEVGGP